MVSRRSVTGLLAAALGFSASQIETDARASSQYGVKHTFFVAGVRFQTPVADDVRAGAIIRLREESVAGALAFAILLTSGAKIGYVPKGIAQSLRDAEAWQGYLPLVDRDAVPWKRYKVELVSRVQC